MQLIQETLKTRGGQAIMEKIKAKRDWLLDITNIPDVPGHIEERTVGHKIALVQFNELIDELEDDREESEPEDYGAN